MYFIDLILSKTGGSCSWYYALWFFYTLCYFPNCLYNYTELRGWPYCIGSLYILLFSLYFSYLTSVFPLTPSSLLSVINRIFTCPVCLTYWILKDCILQYPLGWRSLLVWYLLSRRYVFSQSSFYALCLYLFI